MLSNSILFVLVRKKNDFAEAKVHLIHRKHVPLLHNTVLFYAIKELDLVVEF